MMTASGPLLLSVALLLGPGGGDGSVRGPFDDADLAPPDVDVYVQVERAASARADLSARPIARLLDTVISTGELARAWHKLAEAAGLEDEELFDLWLGRRFAFMSRPDGEGTDWAVLTEVDPKLASTILHPLDPKWRAPQYNLPVIDLPEQELLLARDGSTFLIGPKHPGRLFDQLLPRVAGVRTARASLADDPMMATARSLGSGHIGVFKRHTLPLGGVSAAVADFTGPQIAIAYAGRFENPPFSSDKTTELRWNVSLLDAFEDNSLLAIVQPTDVGGGPAEAFLETTIGAPLLSRQMRENRGDVQLVAIGEIEGRQEPHGTDMLLPAGAVAIRIKDPQLAEQELDIHCLRMARAVEDLGDGVYRLEIPRRDSFEPGELRHVDLRPALDAFAGDFPLLSSVSANWTVTSGPRGSYYVIATHPEQLERTVRALQAELPGDGRSGRLQQCGIFNGPRLSYHLRSYSDRAELLTTTDCPEALAEFRDTVNLLADLAGGIDRCRWQVARPTAKEVRLKVLITLSPPESAEGE